MLIRINDVTSFTAKLADRRIHLAHHLIFYTKKRCEIKKNANLSFNSKRIFKLKNGITIILFGIK